MPEKTVTCIERCVSNGRTRSVAVTFCNPAGLPRLYRPTSSMTALSLLLAGTASKTRDFRPKCSWLDDSTGLG